MSDEGEIQALPPIDQVQDGSDERAPGSEGPEEGERVEDNQPEPVELDGPQPEPELQTITVRIPRVTKSASAAVLELLQSEHMMTRPPVFAAPLLALIVYLYKNQEPFPDRADVAEYLGCSISTVDAALSTRIDQGYITMRVETEHGSVEQRPHSSVRLRFYDPSPALIEVVAHADRFRPKNWHPGFWEKERPVSRKHLGYRANREERRKKRLETMQGKLDDQAIRLRYLERELAKRGIISPAKTSRNTRKNPVRAPDEHENNHSQ